jgi:hypothetical protein
MVELGVDDLIHQVLVVPKELTDETTNLKRLVHPNQAVVLRMCWVNFGDPPRNPGSPFTKGTTRIDQMGLEWIGMDRNALGVAGRYLSRPILRVVGFLDQLRIGLDDVKYIQGARWTNHASNGNSRGQTFDALETFAHAQHQVEL